MLYALRDKTTGKFFHRSATVYFTHWDTVDSLRIFERAQTAKSFCGQLKNRGFNTEVVEFEFKEVGAFDWP